MSSEGSVPLGGLPCPRTAVAGMELLGGLAGAPRLTQGPLRAEMFRLHLHLHACVWPFTPLPSHFTWDLPHHQQLSWLSKPCLRQIALACPAIAPSTEMALCIPAVPRWMQLLWGSGSSPSSTIGSPVQEQEGSQRKEPLAFQLRLLASRSWYLPTQSGEVRGPHHKCTRLDVNGDVRRETKRRRGVKTQIFSHPVKHGCQCRVRGICNLS